MRSVSITVAYMDGSQAPCQVTVEVPAASGTVRDLCAAVARCVGLLPPTTTTSTTATTTTTTTAVTAAGGGAAAGAAAGAAGGGAAVAAGAALAGAGRAAEEVVVIAKLCRWQTTCSLSLLDDPKARLAEAISDNDK